VIKDAIERAEAIQKETGVSVPWEYFAGLQPGKTEMAVRAGADAPQPDDTPQPEEDDDNADNE